MDLHLGIWIKLIFPFPDDDTRMSVKTSDLIKFCQLDNKYQRLRMSIPSHTGLYFIYLIVYFSVWYKGEEFCVNSQYGAQLIFAIVYYDAHYNQFIYMHEKSQVGDWWPSG